MAVRPDRDRPTVALQRKFAERSPLEAEDVARDRPDG